MTLQFALPQTWRVELLGTQLIRSTERVNPVASPKQLFFYVGLENIEAHSGCLVGVGKVQGSDIKSVKSVFKPGNILYGKLRPYLNKVHLAEVEGICSADIWVLSPTATVDPQYISYYLRSQAVLRRVTQLATGANLPRIDDLTFDSIPIPLPPLLEQRRIVAILRGADELRRLRREADALGENLLPALFIHYFGDPASSRNRYSLAPLGDLLVDTPQNGLYKPSSYYGTGTPIIRIGDFYGGVLNDLSSFSRLQVTSDELERYGLSNNNILINRVNSIEFIGKSALVKRIKEPTVYESNMMRLIIDEDKISPNYLIAFLNTNFARNQMLSRAKRAVNQASINQQDVRQIRVPVPKPSEMEKFDQATELLGRQTSAAKQSHEQLTLAFDCLLARAFTGELTAKWREAHEAELRDAAVERDRLLGLRPVRRAIEVHKEDTQAGLRPPIQSEPRYTLVRDLYAHSAKSAQYAVYQAVQEQDQPFTAQSLADRSELLQKMDISEEATRRALELLAGAGLIIPIRLLDRPTGQQTVLIPAYRALRLSDDARESELAALNANSPS